MLSPYHVQLLKALLQLLTAVRSCVLIFFSGCVSQFGIVIIKSATKREQRYTLDGSDPPSKRDMADLKQRHSIVVLKHGNVCTHFFPRACDGRITACGDKPVVRYEGRHPKHSTDSSKISETVVKIVLEFEPALVGLVWLLCCCSNWLA